MKHSFVPYISLVHASMFPGATVTLCADLSALRQQAADRRGRPAPFRVWCVLLDSGRPDLPYHVSHTCDKCCAVCAGLLAQPAPLSLFPNGFQAALMDAQAQAQPPQQQQPPPLPESSVPLQAPGKRSDCALYSVHCL